MAHKAGKLNHRYTIQYSTTASTSDAGEPLLSWTDEATVWGGREADTGVKDEYAQAGAVQEHQVELVPMRFRAGVTSNKRLLRHRDQTTLSAGVNSNTTTIPITAALNFDGSNHDYLKVDSEIMRVTAGTTSLTVERGALGTTAASHSSAAKAIRVELLEILGVLRADEREDELVVRVAHAS